MLDYILELLKCRDISPALCAVGNASMEAGPLDEADNISNCCGVRISGMQSKFGGHFITSLCH